MEIDGDNIQSDLRALKRLYLLVRSHGNGTSKAYSDLLDGHSRFILKNLLDEETKRVLKVQLQAIAGQVDVSEAETQRQQPDDSDESPEEWHSPQSRLSMTAQSSQNWEKRTEDSDRDRTMGGLDVSLSKGKIFGPPRSNHPGTAEQHIHCVPPSRRQKPCRVCQQNSEKTVESIGDRHSNRFTDQQKNESDGWHWNSKRGIRPSSLSNNGRQTRPFVSDLDSGIEEEGISPPDRIVSKAGREVGCHVSKEASESIKLIEMCISELADQLHLFEKNSCVPETKPAAPLPPVAMPIQYGNLLCEFSSQSAMDPIGHPMYHSLPYLSSSQTCELFRPNNNFIGKGVPTLHSDVTCESREEEYKEMFPTKEVNGRWKTSFATNGTSSSIPPDRSKTSSYGMLPTYMMNLNNSENIHPVDSCFLGSTSGAPKSTGNALMNKNNPSQPSLFHENEFGTQHKCGISRTRYKSAAAMMSHLQPQESDSSADDLYSNWRSEQASSIDGEACSSTDESRELQYTTSTRRSGSWEGSSGTRHSSYSSNRVAEEEFLSSCSSSKSEGHYPSYKQTKKSGISRIHRAYNINHRRQSGKWKKLKDKLAKIFHHHHHFHHRHGDCPNDQAKMSHGASLDKHKREVVNLKRQNETYGEKRAEKIKKSSQVHGKGKPSHFNGLMEGLLRHVRHSKQSKSGKETSGYLAKDKDRHKTLTKSHWWRLLQQHDRGAKFPHKTHKKLILDKEKARFKALPNVKRDES